MRYITVAVLALAIALGGRPAAALTDDKTVPAQLQHVIDTYVAQRGQAEGISGISLRADLGSGQPALAVYTGTDGRTPARPIGPTTLFQIGSNTKHFTAALILLLEAQGKLSIDQTVGHWLPQYPAWKDVPIRSLLNMTSPIPNYSETVEIGEIEVADLHHQFSLTDLVGAVDPTNGKHLPTPSGWFYSNTNNILAALIIQAASGMSYKDALTKMILKPLHLQDTYYADGLYPEQVMRHVPRGLYENHACLLYQPTPCDKPTLGPLIGQDVSGQNMSWAASAGAMVSTPRDLATWIRALFGHKIVPPAQLKEMMTLVSQKTGKPIQDVSPEEPAAFGLDLGRIYKKDGGGSFWFYEGETLGFRVMFAYWPRYDLVITAGTNSQPPEGEDKLGPGVVAAAFDVLDHAGKIHPR